ncbi:MAG TPA: ABC transporter ATP-binding protein [Ignavibacteria bacterium]|nr:ABC transporter ATP-binding protein [Ignavibacteria bacterium]
MSNFRKVFKYVKPYRTQFILNNIFTILTVIFSLLSVLMLFPLIDLLFNNSKISQQEVTSIWDIKTFILYHLSIYLSEMEKSTLLLYICGLIFITFTLKNLFSYLQTVYMSKVELGILKDIRFDLFKKYLELPLTFYSNEKKGNLIARIINDVQILKDSFITVLNSLFRDPPTIIIFSVVLFLLNWKMTLLIFVLAPLSGFILSKIGNSIKRSSIKSQEKISDITSNLDEILGAIRIVKSFAMEKYEINKFKRENNRFAEIMLKINKKRALGSPISETIGVITIVLILYLFALEILSGSSELTPGSFILYLAIFFQMIPSLKYFGQMFNSYKEGSAAADRVFELLDYKTEIKNPSNPVFINSFNDSIEFVNATFSYSKEEVLKNVNLKINKGEIVAIVGSSGAGKSTLIDLILRFYDLNSGSLLIDKLDIKNYDIDSLRNIMGIVNQETILFNDTLKNNIAYGKTDIALEDVINAAKNANAHNFISKLPDGYDTIIGDRGQKLSGGERQRISIARTLLKNPPILILDEATSSLDSESELQVQSAIKNLMEGRTSIVIAHRLSTIKMANKIIVLDKGKIVETGTHQSLMQINGVYKKLYDIQFKTEEKI